MSEFTASVTGYTEVDAVYFTMEPAKTLGGIVVKPPFSPGEDFKSVVLGQDNHRVDVRHIITTDTSTVLLAESSRGDENARHEDVQAIAERVMQLANAPETVNEMLESTPFPDQRHIR